VHSAADQVQRCTHADQRLELLRHPQSGPAIVQVPSVPGVVGESGMRRGQIEQFVERVGPRLLVGSIHHGNPPLQEVGHLQHVGVGAGQVNDQTCLLATVLQLIAGQRRIPQQVNGQQHGVLAVRVEMHKSITSC